MRATKTEDGFTLIEMAVAVTIFTIGMAILMTSFESASDLSTQAAATAMNDAEVRRSTTKIIDLIAESSAASVDTMARYHSTGASVDFATDRFWTSSMRQCWSSTCSFHTRPDLSVDGTRYACSLEYRRGYGTTTSAMGKVWGRDQDTCAFDGNQLSTGANLDGIKLLVARSDGSFQMDQGNPLWRTMVFIFPRRSDDGLMELARYELRIDDILAAMPVESTNWSRWTAADLDWNDLLDFGGDGTTDGIPDGSVPLTPETSDASEEIFSNATSSHGPAVVFTKTVGSWGLTFRHLTIVLYLESGLIDFSVSHYEDSSTYWNVDGTVTRAPEVLIRGVTEFAVSTADSDPWDATINPTGVEQEGIVRVHVGTSRKYRRDGQELWAHQVDTFTVRPRN